MKNIDLPHHRINAISYNKSNDRNNSIFRNNSLLSDYSIIPITSNNYNTGGRARGRREKKIGADNSSVGYGAANKARYCFLRSANKRKILPICERVNVFRII